MIQILKDKEIDKGEWEGLLNQSPYASFFQSKEAYDLYNSLDFMEGFVLAVKENDKLTGLICGYIIADGGKIKQFFSRRAIIPGGAMLHIEISKDALSLLLSDLKEYLSKKAIYIEFRNYKDYAPYKDVFVENGFEYQPHLNFHVATDDVDSALMRLNSTKRRDVRVSLKNGAEIVELYTSAEINEYFQVLSEMYKTRVKTPLFPFEFFYKIVTNGVAKLFGIKYNNEIIGGSLTVELPNKILYEWFVCGEDRKYKNIYPSTLATWAAIEYAAKNGFKYFDMMGAGKPDASYGVRDFKSKFGGEMMEHGRFILILKHNLYKLGKQFIKFKKQIK